MKLKINENREHILEDIIKSILNIACVVCCQGYIPNDKKRNQPEKTGSY